MKRWNQLLYLALCLGACAHGIHAGAQESEVLAASVDANTFNPSRLGVVLIAGRNKDPEEIRSKSRTITRLAAHFASAGVAPEDLVVLAGEDCLADSVTGPSTAEGIRQALARFQSLSESDRLVIYYTGQANFVGRSLRLNVPGPDLTHDDFARLVKGLHPGLLTVVLDCPGAGLAAEALAGPRRLLIFAARSDQPTSTRFSDYFVPALNDFEADFNHDGTITVLEAFQQTARQLDALFREQHLMKSENTLLEDDGDGTPSQEPWMFATAGHDGATAAKLAADTWEVCYTCNEAVEQEPYSTNEDGPTP